VASQLVFRLGEDHDAGLRVLEERHVHRNVQAAAHDHRKRVGEHALAFALGAELVGLDDRAVALGADRAGARHHRVGLGAEVVEDLAVGLARDRARPALHGGLAVRGGHHVEREVGALGGRLLSPAQTGDHLGRIQLRGVGMDSVQPHAARDSNGTKA